MSDNSINSPTFTELELSGIAIVLYLLISQIHGISKITEPILKMFNIKSATSLLFFTGFLFGVIYYFSIELVLHPMYNKLRAVGFKVGGPAEWKGGTQNDKSNSSKKSKTNQFSNNNETNSLPRASTEEIEDNENPAKWGSAARRTQPRKNGTEVRKNRRGSLTAKTPPVSKDP